MPCWQRCWLEVEAARCFEERLVLTSTVGGQQHR
jgi:hypothetical protein